MTVVAEIDHSQSPAVVLTVVDYGGDEVPQAIQDEMGGNWVDVTSVNPRPQIGWTYDGTNFAPTTAESNSIKLQENLQKVVETNIAYLNGPQDAAAQAAQIVSLTHQGTAFLRLQLGATDTLDGTGLT